MSVMVGAKAAITKTVVVAASGPFRFTKVEEDLLVRPSEADQEVELEVHPPYVSCLAS